MQYTDQEIEIAITALMDRGQNKAVAVRTVLLMMQANLKSLIIPAGVKFKFGSGVPNAALGDEGDLYDNILTGDRYQKQADGTWLYQYRAKGEAGYTPQKGKDYQDGYTPRKGIDYRDGTDGKSAYEVWLGAGNVGSVAVFLNSLRGSATANDGKDGTIYHQEAYDPAETDGNDGDIWQNAVSMTTERRYKKVAGAWRKFYDNTTVAVVTPPANAAPTVQFNAPATGATLTKDAPITLTATAKDDKAVVSVEFFNGVTGASLGIGAQNGSTFSLPYIPTAAGNLTLQAVATDAQGESTTATVIVTVQGSVVISPANTPPNTLVAVAGTATVPKFTAQAADSDGVQSIFVKVYADAAATQLVATFGPSAPGDTSYITPWAAAPAGTYYAFSVATDTKGLSATSSPGVQFTVAAATVAPTITSFTPVTGPIATTVTVKGTGFGATQSTSTIAYNGVQVTPVSWNDTTILFVIPTGATSGKITVTTVGGSVTSASSFAITAPVAGYDGRPVQVLAFGDSRTRGYPDGSSPWPEALEPLLNQNAGTGKYQTVNGGQPGQGSDFAVSAAASTGYMPSKRDTVTFWRQLVIVWFGVNDQLHNPSWTAQQTLDNLRQVVQSLTSVGFYVVVVTEPISAGWDPDAGGGNWNATPESKAKRLAINDGIRTKAVSEWGAFDYADVDTVVAIQNMADKTNSPDGLHYTPATDVTYLAPFFAGVVNKWAAAMGVPTSTSSGGGGAVTPSAPALAEAGRTLTAKAGNGLPDSTLRYKIRNGAEVVGSTYTVPAGETLDANDFAVYSVATGNYSRSPFAYNKNSYAAVYTAILRNPYFTNGPVTDDLTGWRVGTQFNDSSQLVTVGGGICEFKGKLYDYISQQTQNQVVGKTYRITLVVDSMSGGDFILKTVYLNTVNKRFSTAQTITIDYVAQYAQEGFNLGAEGNTVGRISFFDIQPVN
jgi:lysophospholipase L1-like esterase